MSLADWLPLPGTVTDVGNREKVDAYNERSVAVMHRPGPSELVEYVNATRGGPLELRYREERRWGKLKRLKRECNPTEVLRTQLL